MSCPLLSVMFHFSFPPNCPPPKQRCILAAEAKSFEKFVAFIGGKASSGGHQCAERGLLQEIVGEFKEEEDKVLPNFTRIYQIHAKSLPESFPAFKVEATDGAEESSISCAHLCAAGALLPLAKMVVHISAWSIKLSSCPPMAAAFGPQGSADMFKGTVMQSVAEKDYHPDKLISNLNSAHAAAQVTTVDSAAVFVKACCAKIGNIITKIIDIAESDFKGVMERVIKSYDSMDKLAEFTKALDNGIIDAGLTASLCSSSSLETCYQFLTYACEHVHLVKKFLIAISTALTSCQAEFKGFPLR